MESRQTVQIIQSIRPTGRPNQPAFRLDCIANLRSQKSLGQTAFAEARRSRPCVLGHYGPGKRDSLGRVTSQHPKGTVRRSLYWCEKKDANRGSQLHNERQLDDGLKGS